MSMEVTGKKRIKKLLWLVLPSTSLLWWLMALWTVFLFTRSTLILMI